MRLLHRQQFLAFEAPTKSSAARLTSVQDSRPLCRSAVTKLRGRPLEPR
jgi:hypothetical protein